MQYVKLSLAPIEAAFDVSPAVNLELIDEDRTFIEDQVISAVVRALGEIFDADITARTWSPPAPPNPLLTEFEVLPF